MRNKKTIALAMAAATVAPMAVPAFAAEKSLSGQTMDVMLADGYEILVKTNTGKIVGTSEVTNSSTIVTNLLTRDEVFDQNGTEYTSDDTIKTTLGEGAKVLVVKEGNDPTGIADDLYVVVKKAASNKVVEAKEKIALANAEIAQLEKDGYTITTTNTAARYNGNNYEPSKIVKTAKLDTVTKTFEFRGTENVKDDDTVLNLQKLFTEFKPDVNKNVSLNLKSGNYDTINKIKYIIESNLSKFDIVKYEMNPVNGVNQDLWVDIYKKGAKGVGTGRVITVKFNEFAKVNKDLIINMPSTTDIDGHWAEADIKEAMLKGHVDASSTFNPKSDITRAEFSKMLCTVLGINADKAVEDKKEEPFHDVTSSDWYYKYIVALYNYNPSGHAKKGAVINGYEGDLFKPNAKITREEAAKMIATVYDIKTKGLHVAHGAGDNDKDFTAEILAEKLKSTMASRDGIIDITKKVNGEIIHRDIKTKFVDDKDIAPWADEAVAALSGNAYNASGLKVIGGNPDGTFKPKSNINRAEALVMIQRAAK